MLVGTLSGLRSSLGPKERKKMATNAVAISHRAEATSFWQGAVVVLGRFFFAFIFLMAGSNHFSK